MILKYILCAVIAYLLGSISTGILVSQKAGHNLRQEGSHNTGASNALRVLGLKGGAITFLGDFLKAFIAVMVGKWIGGLNGGMIAGLFVVLGHNWPVFFGFQGGKGIACSAAVMTLFPIPGVIAAALCLLVIFIWRYISVGSLTMLTVFFLILAFTQPFWPVALWAFALLLLGIYRHRANLQRLKNGTENKIGQKAK